VLRVQQQEANMLLPRMYLESEFLQKSDRPYWSLGDRLFNSCFYNSQINGNALS